MRIRTIPFIKQAYPFTLFLIATLAFAHGEDKPGPHGGFIRMPGAYHTEVVPKGGEELEVYLLDINWKNPVVKNSSVELNFEDGKNHKISCAPKANARFLCRLPKGSSLNKPGALRVRSERNGFKGNEALYPLPLSFGLKEEGSAHQH
jgi:hypothetical protein